MAYRVEYDNAALRAIERLLRKMQERIVERIGLPAENPRPHGSIKLAKSESYRVRVGDYRIIYTIFDKQLVVLVIDVGNRRDIYRR